MRKAAATVATVGTFSGWHVLAEMHGVDSAKLDDEPFLRLSLEDALSRAGATVLTVTSQRFQPQGVTVLALLSESHASIHTYPEFGSIFLDVFTCGTKANPELAVRLLSEALGGTRMRTKTIHRGRSDPTVE